MKMTAIIIKKIYVNLNVLISKNSFFFIIFFTSISKIAFSNDLNEIVINLGWKHQFEFAGFYAAKELGYYKDEGLDVDFFDYDYYIFPKKDEFNYFIISASSFLGQPDRDSYIVVTTFFQQSPLSLLVRKDSTIRTVKDLYGKKLAVGSEIRAMLSAAGLDLTKIELVDHKTGLNNLDTLDGITYYINDVFLGGKDSDKYKLFRPIEYGVNFYGECLVTTKKEFQDNLEQVEKMRRATIKGWQYAMENPKEVAIMIHEKYNQDLTVNQLLAEAEIVRNSMVLPELFEIGTSERNKWVNMNNILIKQGIVDKPLDVENIIYEPELKKTGEYIFWLKIIISALFVVLGLAFLMQYHNIRLKQQVKLRTLELAKTNKKLKGFNEFKNRIIAIISHDARGPLNRLSGLLELYANGNLTEEESEPLFKKLGTEVEDVRLLLDNLLLWSGKLLNKGQIEITQDFLDVEGLIDKVTHLYAGKIQEKSITIKKEICGDKLKGDENIVGTILRNLIVNAIKYAPYKGEVIIQCQKDLDGKVIFSIKDNGMGMDENTKNKLFNSSTKSLAGSKGEKGNGIGLFLCKGLIELYEGEIWVDSELGNGSSFHFSIPNT